VPQLQVGQLDTGTAEGGVGVDGGDPMPLL
jgi:hypothetical protein